MSEILALVDSILAEADSELDDEVFKTTLKGAGPDVSRIVPPSVTLERVVGLFEHVGITRVANLTGLDRIGIPVVAVMRPNSRSYAVAQGKGVTLEAAKASGVMESIENYHAEEACFAARFGRHRDLRKQFELANVAGLPRLATSLFNEDYPLLWAEGAVDLTSGAPTLVPYELASLDFRVPRPQGSGCFLASSNGLASGNHLQEATAHALCELIERDANTIWHLSGGRAQRRRRIDLETVDDPCCKSLLARFADAGVGVLAWETTSDVGVASVLCDVFDLDPDPLFPMPPVGGSGCHPLRRIAVSRALTEAAQGRLTRISGSRDDLTNHRFEHPSARRSNASNLELLREPGAICFGDIPNLEHDTVEEDVLWLCDSLRAAGLHQILRMDLTRDDLGVPVVRMVVPQLEGLSEVPGYVPGVRARRFMEEAWAAIS
jgi:ribosomal protein S12 methylthiotransferase accessory factor